jgi:hypothetical protein
MYLIISRPNATTYPNNVWPSGIIMRHGTLTLATRSIDHPESSRLSCDLHRHDKDLACHLLSSPGQQLSLTPRESFLVLEPLQIHTLTITNPNANNNGTCAIDMTVSDPNLFVVPDAIPASQEQELLAGGADTHCTGVWNCSAPVVSRNFKCSNYSSSLYGYLCKLSLFKSTRNF